MHCRILHGKSACAVSRSSTHSARWVRGFSEKKGSRDLEVPVSACGPVFCLQVVRFVLVQQLAQWHMRGKGPRAVCAQDALASLQLLSHRRPEAFQYDPGELQRAFWLLRWGPRVVVSNRVQMASLAHSPVISDM